MVEGGAKASQIFMCVLHLCLKPETSEMQQKCFHAIVKVKFFSMFPTFPKGTSGSAVLKNRYLGPAFHALKCFLRDRKSIVVLFRMDNKY